MKEAIMDPSVEMWFPVSIYKDTNIISQEENMKLYNRSLELQKTIPNGGKEWYGDTYNTHDTFDLTRDSTFDYLLSQIEAHVHNYAEMHGSTSKYKLSGAWLNVNTEGTFQEFHTHNNAIFSCVYWVAAPEGSGKLIFEDPKEPDMLQIRDIKERNSLSFTRIGYKAEERKLLIFRSYLRHMVEPCKNTTPRVSIAVNFS
tara:strand:+ start:1875 stop:2474 length:600 start_codon:yes stop_codon:yes gene_type:complete